MDSRTPFYDYFHTDDEIANYFNALPEDLKSTLIQSHSDIKTVGEFKSIADGLLGENRAKGL